MARSTTMIQPSLAQPHCINFLFPSAKASHIVSWDRNQSVLNEEVFVFEKEVDLVMTFSLDFLPAPSTATTSTTTSFRLVSQRRRCRWVFHRHLRLCSGTGASCSNSSSSNFSRMSAVSQPRCRSFNRSPAWLAPATSRPSPTGCRPSRFRNRRRYSSRCRRSRRPSRRRW